MIIFISDLHFADGSAGDHGMVGSTPQTETKRSTFQCPLSKFIHVDERPLLVKNYERVLITGNVRIRCTAPIHSMIASVRYRPNADIQSVKCALEGAKENLSCALGRYTGRGAVGFRLP